MAEFTYERVLELFAETDKRFEQKMERISSEFSKSNKELTKKISDLGDTLVLY